MSAPIPSFFKMRLVIAIALVFLGFFFIGLLNRAFADGLISCAYRYNFFDNYDGPNTYHVTDYLTPDAALSACTSDWGSSNCSDASSSTYFQYVSWPEYQVGYYYIVCQDCIDADLDSVCDDSVSDCEDTDGDGTKDPCDDCPDNPDITRDQIGYFIGSSGLEDIGFSIGDYCGYVEFDCSRDPAESALVHPTAGLSYGQFEVYCTSDNSSAGQCRVTDDCKRDSDGDGISDTDDTDDDNDGTLDLYDDDDGDRIPDDHDNNFLVDEDPNKPNPEPYTIPFLASVVQRFAERLSLFFERMKQTSLFSLPNQLTGSAHFSGGHSTFVIEGGEVYGRQEIDFTVWSGGLVVFRVVIYISAIFTSVRIVTLKR